MLVNLGFIFSHFSQHAEAFSCLQMLNEFIVVLQQDDDDENEKAESYYFLSAEEDDFFYAVVTNCCTLQEFGVMAPAA